MRVVAGSLSPLVEGSTLVGSWVDAQPHHRVAVIDAGTGERLTFGQLRDRIDARRQELDLPPRALVTLAGEQSTEWIVTYLALLASGHVPLLTPAHTEPLITEHLITEPLITAWRPNAGITVTRRQFGLTRHHDQEVDLHPDLALLLSTSGSTGSPKLVRLSHTNLASNARAIADYLGLHAQDRAITSLPLHYCYGLSVLHSHLAAGASVVATTASVVDPCFHRALREHGVTTLAGVPHTFDMIERAGPERVLTPTLRIVTQAGGRLAPDAVQRWEQHLRPAGIQLFVMYGQTEATARIAYLPPHLVAAHPGAIGVPIPGGELRIDHDVDLPAGIASDAGELVYRGPNVMLGYADTPDDLALGPTLTELRTGDLARRDPATGLFEIVGRRSRFVKPFGLRIDLDGVEAALAEAFPGELAVAGDDRRLRIVAPGRDADTVRATTARLTSLPPRAIDVFVDRPVPRTSTGKIDSPAAMAWQAPTDRQPPTTPSGAAGPAAAVFAEVLGRHTIADTDTFVSLGGDSLSYVECSLRLEQVLGSLPADWHLRPVGELQLRGQRRRLASVDTTVVLRAIGILAVVATHMRVVYVPGGAHLMLAVVGYNFARFLTPITDARQRLRSGLRTAARVAAPTLAWIAGGMLLGAYGWSTLSFANNYVGPSHHEDDYWHFWFIEVFVHLTLAATLLLMIPAVRRLERRHGYRFVLGVVAATLVLRLDWPGLDPLNVRFRTHGVAWCFALGWLVQRSETTARKLVTSLVIVVAVADFFSYLPREAFVTTGILSLLWLPRLALPWPLARALATLAAASMWILITHFTVWPVLVAAVGRPLAYPITVLAGVLVAGAIGRMAIASRWLAAGAQAALARRRPSQAPIADPSGQLVRMT